MTWSTARLADNDWQHSSFKSLVRITILNFNCQFINASLETFLTWCHICQQHWEVGLTCLKDHSPWLKLNNTQVKTFVIMSTEPPGTKSWATGAGRSGISLHFLFMTITATFCALEQSTGTQISGTGTLANGLYLYETAIPRSTTNVCLNQRFVIFSVIPIPPAAAPGPRSNRRKKPPPATTGRW